jgi:hypothetical protein
MTVPVRRRAPRRLHLNQVKAASHNVQCATFDTPIIGGTLMDDAELKNWTRSEIARCQALGRPSKLQQRLMTENTNPRSMRRAQEIRQELLDAEAGGATPECVRSILNAVPSRSSRSSPKGHSFPGPRAAHAPAAGECAPDRGKQSRESSPARTDVRQARRSLAQGILDLFGRSNREQA